MKLNFIKKTLLLLTLSLAIVSCNNLETDDHLGHSISLDKNPTVTVNLNFATPVVFHEAAGDMTHDYTVTLSETQIVDTKIYINQVGGTATNHDDYDMTTSIIIPAGYTSGSGSITLYYDEVLEGDETLTIEVGDQRTANAAFSPVTVDITIIDYVFCLWNINMVDLYGDGWNGGVIKVESEGTSTDYAAEGSGTNIDVAITDGADFTITYVAAAGNGGGPGWEIENVYTITSPDGTVWTDGPIPASGVITSGTNDCP